MAALSEAKSCAYNYFPDDSKIKLKTCFPNFGRVHSSRMYAVNCPDLDKKSGIYEFMYAMDDEERKRVAKDHAIVDKMNAVSDANIRMGVLVGSLVGVGMAMPFLLAPPTTAAAALVITTSSGVASGLLNAYSKTHEVTTLIETDRLRRLANKVSLIKIQYDIYENENNIRGMRNLKILQNYFEATLNENRSITFFTMEK